MIQGPVRDRTSVGDVSSGLDSLYLVRAYYLSRIIRVARETRALQRTNDMAETIRKKQNITISLSPEMIKKAKVLAAQRSTSISGLLAEQIESLVDSEEAYERSQRAALVLLEKGFRLGGMIRASRDELHER